MHSFHPHWKYPNLTFLVFSLIATYFLLRNGWLHPAVEYLGGTGYLGVFVAGLFFTSTFTVAPAAAILYAFAQELNPYLIAVIGGAGAMIGDYVAMRFIREQLMAEISPFLKMLHIYKPVDIFHSKYFAWLAPVVGAAIIASPLPDEAGLVLLGASQVSLARLMTVMFLMNTAGIFLITLAAR